MDTWFYTVVNIDGDYANLKRTDIDSDELKLVARALCRLTRALQQQSFLIQSTPRSLSVPWHIIERSGHGIYLCNKN